MSALSEISNEDLYKIFAPLEKLKGEIVNHPESNNLVKVLDEVLKLRAEVEKIKANQTPRIEQGDL